MYLINDLCLFKANSLNVFLIFVLVLPTPPEHEVLVVPLECPYEIKDLVVCISHVKVCKTELIIKC